MIKFGPLKNIFDEEVSKEVLLRLSHVRAESPRKFGTMTAPQMVNHLNTSFEAYLGKLGMSFQGNVLYAKISKFFTFTPIPIPRGRVKIPKDRESRGTYDIDAERARFCTLLQEYRDKQFAGDWPDHLFLGKLTPDEYGKLAYKHIDHHFRQFGV